MNQKKPTNQEPQDISHRVASLGKVLDSLPSGKYIIVLTKRAGRLDFEIHEAITICQSQKGKSDER